MKFTKGQEVFISIGGKMKTMMVFSGYVHPGEDTPYLILFSEDGNACHRIHPADIYLTNPRQEVFDFDLTDQDNDDK